MELDSVIQLHALLDINTTNPLSYVAKDVELIIVVPVQTMELVMLAQMDMV